MCNLFYFVLRARSLCNVVDTGGRNRNSCPQSLWSVLGCVVNEAWLLHMSEAHPCTPHIFTMTVETCLTYPGPGLQRDEGVEGHPIEKQWYEI